MNIATYSPALAVMFGWLLMCILMDVRWWNLSTLQKWLTPGLCLLLSVFNHVLRDLLGAEVYGQLILFAIHLPTFVYFRYLTKHSCIKVFFMILTALVFTAPTVLIGNLLQRTMVIEARWVLLVTNLISYALVLLLVQSVFRKGFNFLLKYGENRSFWLLSVVPFLYYIYVFFATNLDVSGMNSTGGFIVRYLPTIQVLVFYFLLLNSYRNLSQKKEMEKMQAALTQELDAAAGQIELLSRTQTRTAMYQHDMRHHLTAIGTLLAAGKTQQAMEYIQEVRSDVDAITPKIFCENELVNLLCTSFSEKAERMGIRLDVEAYIPQKISVSDTEICSLISNGLENALKAVDQLDKPYRTIAFYCKVRHNKMLIEIKNRCIGKVTIQDGVPVSERDGHGYGCRSILAIAERNRGHCSFEQENDMFVLRVVLPVSAEERKM